MFFSGFMGLSCSGTFSIVGGTQSNAGNTAEDIRGIGGGRSYGD